MRYYLSTICSYIHAQLQADTQENGLLVIIPSLDEQVAAALGDQLQQMCLQLDTALEYKIAREQYEKWSMATQDKLNNLGYCAQESLTSLRNKLVSCQRRTLLVLIGAAYVTDKASLEDFHHCDEESLWKNALKQSFAQWLQDYFKANHLTHDDHELEFGQKILAELRERFDLLTLSNWLDDTRITANSASGAFAELLNNLDTFGLPHLGGLVEDNRKSRTFRQCLDNAEGFFSYSKFLETASRKKALEHIQAFQDSDTELELEKVRPFATPEDFYGALTEYIRHHNLEHLDALRHCDFIYIWENILKFKPNTQKPTPKETLHKLDGSPLEVVLQAAWSSFGYFKDMPAKIIISGKRFVHDYPSDDGDATKSTDAEKSLASLLGGLDKLLNAHLQLQNADGDAIAVQAALLKDIKYEEAKNREPFYEFHVFLECEGKAETYKFAWKLPAIHPYRLANELLYLAEEALYSSPDSFPLPIFHLKYYEELFEAVDEDESCRLLQHCIQEADKSATPFMENIFTENWRKEKDQKPLADKIEKISTAYKNFINDAVEHGLTAALFESGTAVVQAYYDACRAYTADPAASQCHKLAAMLMRSFMFIGKKGDNIDSWSVSISEPGAIVSILHPAIIEMQQAKMLFLLTAFNYMVNQENTNNGKFKIRQWQSFEDMSTMQMPLPGLLINGYKKLSINIRGRGLLHRIGELENKTTSMSTRLMTRYDAIDDEQLNTAQFFKETRESKLLYRLLMDYKHTHPHCQDGISMAVYRNEDLQPVLSALDNFLKTQREDGFISPKSDSKYFVKLVLFTESTDDTGVCNLLRQWRECWETTDEDESKLYYPYCQISVSHRIVSKEQDHREFKRILENEIDTDIIVFYNFIETDSSGNDFSPATEFDSTRDTLKFPILEKTFCANLEPDVKLKRAQIVSNRQFKINAAFTELLARISNSSTPLNQWHIILGHGDYEPWQDIIEAAHACAEWVVCIDANIDERLLQERKRNTKDGRKRELIGFGSGVGIHGESNYTVSTQKYAFDDLRLALLHSFQSIFEYGTEEDDNRITAVLVDGAARISGLSLIRAIGHSEYKRDFIAYNMMRKILPMAGENHLCDQMFSIDAYRHWFDLSDEENNRPDLLWLRADLDEQGKLAIDMRLIECKMAKENEEHIIKAASQIENGLKVLVKAFYPKVEGEEIPDQRYWHLQLHRLIASCAQVNNDKQKQFPTALEALIAGDFTIKWNAGIFAFWTDVQQADAKHIESLDIEANEATFKVPVYTMGYDFIRNICNGQPSPLACWDEGGITMVPIQNAAPQPGAPRRQQPTDTLPIEPVKPVELTDSKDTVLPVTPAVQPPVNTVEPVKPVKPPVVSLAGIPQRIFLGNATSGSRKIYWEFGHKGLNNRHLLIFGSSGSGKTYAIQTILCELGHQQLNSMIVDYTQGFLPTQLHEVTQHVLAPEQIIVKRDKLSMHPFKRYSVDLGGISPMEDQPKDVAKRVTSILKSVYGMGDQQASILIDAITEGMNSGNMTLDTLTDILKKYASDQVHVKSAAQTVLSKLKPFIIEQPFNYDQDFGWNELFSNERKKCHVVQLAGEDADTYKILTEIILWDLYYFCSGSSTEETPKVVVLDEVQNLDHRQDSPLGKILTEGRKFGLAVIAATQTLSNLKSDERARLSQSGHKLFFKPADTELNQYAEIITQISTSQYDKNHWIQQLAGLKRGECFSIGPVLNEENGSLKNEVVKIQIEALENRDF